MCTRFSARLTPRLLFQSLREFVVLKFKLLCQGRCANILAECAPEFRLPRGMPWCDAVSFAAIADGLWMQAALDLQVRDNPRRLLVRPACLFKERHGLRDFVIQRRGVQRVQ